MLLAEAFAPRKLVALASQSLAGAMLSLLALCAGFVCSVVAQCPNHPHLDLCVMTTTTDNATAEDVDTNRGGRSAAWMALALPLVAARPSFAAAFALAMMATSVNAHGHGMSCSNIRTFYQAQSCCSEGDQPMPLDFSTSEGSSFSNSVCEASNPVGVCHCEKALQLLSQVDGVQFPVEFCSQMADVKPVGYHDQPICEASDAGANAAYLVDGKAGNTNFPHGNIKVLATAGEVDPTTGSMLTGRLHYQR